MAESNFSLQKTLTMLLDEKKYHSLRDILSTMNPADIAAIFDDLGIPAHLFKHTGLFFLECITAALFSRGQIRHNYLTGAIYASLRDDWYGLPAV